MIEAKPSLFRNTERERETERREREIDRCIGRKRERGEKERELDI